MSATVERGDSMLSLARALIRSRHTVCTRGRKALQSLLIAGPRFARGSSTWLTGLPSHPDPPLASSLVEVMLIWRLALAHEKVAGGSHAEDCI